jgi:lipid-binding SYLF domain-containing protein
VKILISLRSTFIRLSLSLPLLLGTVPAWAESGDAIHARAIDAMATFEVESPAGHEVLQKAEGILVFPDIVKMGFGVGGEYGEGVLLIDGEPTAYYSTAAASIGWQVGLQFKAYILAFMTQEALRNFQTSKGWRVGVDGSVAIIKAGVGGKFDTETVQQPVLGFVFSNRGLMYNLTLEGSKITKLVR